MRPFAAASARGAAARTPQRAPAAAPLRSESPHAAKSQRGTATDVSRTYCSSCRGSTFRCAAERNAPGACARERLEFEYVGGIRAKLSPLRCEKICMYFRGGSIGRRVDASRGGLGGITALGFCSSAASNGDGLASRSRRRGQRRRRWWSAGARASIDGRRARSPSLAR